LPGEYFLWEGQTKDTGPICDVRYESNTNFNIIKRYFSVKQGICPSFFLVFVEATKKRQKYAAVFAKVRLCFKDSRSERKRIFLNGSGS